MIDFKQKMEKEEQQNMELDSPFENNKRQRKIRFYIILIMVSVLIFSGKIIMSSPQTNQWIQENTFIGKIRHLSLSPEKKLMGEANDRINILLLGIGGAGHDGAYLTDTIMLASLKPSTKEAALLSLPRDLTAPNSSGSWRKINSINAIAEAQKSGSGGQASAKAIGDMLGIQIHYYLRLDFAGFVNVINELGGIEVMVENTLSDYSYPIDGQENNPNYYSRFEHLYIEKGLQKMDGNLALKFVRSRHAAGIEGSDFARSRRQQLVLQAVKDKLLSRDLFLKPAMLSRIISELDKSVQTNLHLWEMLKLWNDYKDIQSENISNHVFDDGPRGFLVASRGENGAYILIPRSGNFQQIRAYVANIFGEDEASEKLITYQEGVVAKSLSRVTVINATLIGGLAANTADNLKRAGFDILEVGNAPVRDLETSRLYDLTYGKNPEDLEKIVTISGIELAYDAPEWLDDYRQKDPLPDFILVLGLDN